METTSRMMGIHLTLMFILLPSMVYRSEGALTYTLTVPKGQLPWDFNLLDNHHQSPTDLRLDAMEDISTKQYHPLTIKAVRDSNIKYVVRNSGHGVEVVVDPQELETRRNYVRPILYGGILPDIYVFQNVHYHWGEVDEDGSEHRLNGRSFSLEGHVVMFKKEYGTFKNAVEKKDGIVVLTFFGQCGEHNPELDQFLQLLPQVKNYGSGNIPFTGTDPFLWFLSKAGELNKDYLAYPGSLTTPGYQETVTFVILPNPIPLSHEQLAQFRHLISDHHKEIKSNKRALQPFQHRPIAISRNNFKVDYEFPGDNTHGEFKHQGENILEDHNFGADLIF